MRMVGVSVFFFARERLREQKIPTTDNQTLNLFGMFDKNMQEMKLICVLCLA